MLLLDRNNEPNNTVYYLAAVSYGVILTRDGVDASTLFDYITKSVIKKTINYDFFVMALDFLYLLDKVSVDEEGGLHVHSIGKTS